MRGLQICGVALSTAIFAFAACSAATDDGKTFGGEGGSQGSGSSSGMAQGGGGAASASSSSNGGFVDGGLTGSGGGGAVGDCSEAAKLIYVVGTTYELYSYSPPTKEFKQIGMLNCPSNGATPFSMAVDRQGIAWVLYNDGNIFHVDISNGASCSKTNYVPGQAGFLTFGMGFVADTPGGTEETLYIGNYNGQNLGKLDPKTLSVSPVGNYSGGNGLTGAAEITGTGSARLFGFFYKGFGQPAYVAEIDKSNAFIQSVASPNNVEIGSGWAFAAWGGSFYLFTAPNGDSVVTKFTLDPNDPSVGTVNIEVPSVGFVIVGAGVSTCAPVEPPK